MVFLGAYLELEGAQAALEDRVGAVVERGERRHVPAAADPDAVRGPQVRRQVLWQLSVCSTLCLGKEELFKILLI